MKTYLTIFKTFILILCISLASCQEYLNVVPDNIPTVDHAFKNRHEAEGFLMAAFPSSLHLPMPVPIRHFLVETKYGILIL